MIQLDFLDVGQGVHERDGLHPSASGRGDIRVSEAGYDNDGSVSVFHGRQMERLDYSIESLVFRGDLDDNILKRGENLTG